MSGFFAARISSNASDFAILRGVLAEFEGKEPNELKLTIEGIANTEAGAANELENLFR